MKKQFFFAIICCLFALAACNDFLVETPLSNMSKDEFFKSRADGFASVNILYRKGVMGHMSSGSFIGCTYFYPTVYRAGGLINNVQGGNQNEVLMGVLNISANTDYPDGSRTNAGLWTAPYEVIARNVNFALENLPDCPELTDAERDQLMGEAYFFRALNYFYLVNSFGPVPIVTQSYASLDGIYNRRSSVKLVYQRILDDLELALKTNLPDLSMPANKFRVTRGSVLALAADVCLNMAGYPLLDNSKYAEAAKYAKILIESSNYELIKHGASFNPATPSTWGQSAYNTLRTSENLNEHLLVREYDATIANASEQPTWCLPWAAVNYTEFKYPVYAETYMPNQILMSLYDPINDLRFQERQYFHRSYTFGDGTVWTFDREFPFFWWEETALKSTARAEKNMIVYRLAEMYLTAAEALVQAGGTVTSEAAGYLATIQARASLNKTYDQIKTELEALPKEKFVEEVLKERIRELMFEAKLWNDIARTRKYPSLNASNEFEYIPLIGAAPPRNPGTTYTEEKLYFLIPLAAKDRNPMLNEPPLE